MEKAEPYLVKGAEYGAYALERYVDLGKFYLHQQRFEDAERVFLAGLGFRDAALKALPDKDSVKKQIAELNLLLARIYDNRENANCLSIT
ncbi:hypothetical protein Daud_0960 [Candidatus Desulforudis audaxviator MP104C]|uniref:Tetratricopeptide repeat protein n=1 Tax=Desulforudis audaxviator (strain MP104C) TaxID=477974 RepID=B1I3F0_DESAP|nr:hypothetical protein Daud_0960 [Candidatus Desulforudis audaxviator MP104C]